jgi:hypothetical protein
MAAMVLRYRSLSKLHGTYIVGLGEKMDPHYRIHTRFNQDVARTGRLSSSDRICRTSRSQRMTNGSCGEHSLLRKAMS